MAKAKLPKSDSVKTPLFKASWIYLHEAEESKFQPGKFSYSVTMLFPKATTDMGTFTSMIKALREKAFTQEVVDPATRQKKTVPVDPAYLQLPIRDGDTPNTNGVLVESEVGHWVMKAKTNLQPTVLDRDGRTVIHTASQLQAGNLMRANIYFFAYDNIKRGIGATLLSAIKLGDGEPLAFGGSERAEDTWANEVVAPASMGLDL